MIDKLKPYPQYKASGVEWLGEVPEDWDVVPLCSFASPKSIPNQEDRELLSVYLNRGVIKFSDVKEKRTNVTSEDLSKYQAVDPGDFVLNNQQAWRGSVGVSEYSGIVSPAYLVLKLGPRIDTNYANWFFREQSMVVQYLIASKGVGSIQRNLYWPHLKRVSTLLPPIKEQQAIAEFLAFANRRISKAIRLKKKMIKLLEEEKQAIIHQAVIGQIDVRTGEPYPAYKESGVEWLGMVPEEWEVRRLKTISKMKSGFGITTLSIEDSGEFPVYGGNGIRGYASDYTHDGDFALIGRQGALCGNVHLAHGKFWASEHAVVATLYSKFSLEWFSYLLDVMNLNQYSIAAAQPGLAVDRIINLWAPVPPYDTQALICKEMNQAAQRIDKAINPLKNEIDLLNEYRTRLIADVVTGKLDVREAAAALPAEDADDVGDVEMEEAEFIEQEDGTDG